MMKWISVKDRLPEDMISVLGFCHTENDELEWMGLINVFFSRERGWKRCELYDERPVRVLYWTRDFEKPKEFR